MKIAHAEYSVFTRGGFKTAIAVSLALLFSDLANTEPVQPAQLDQFEPNNVSTDAPHIPLFESFHIELTKPDEDWFRVYSPEPGMLMLHYEYDTDSTFPNVELYEKRNDDLVQLEFDAGDRKLSIRMVDKGDYLLKFTQGRSGTNHYKLRLNYIKNKSHKNTLFALAMELEGDAIKSVEKIAILGGGKMIEVSSTTGNLTVALARVAEESRGNLFDTRSYMAAIFDESFRSMQISHDEPFSRAWLVERLENMKGMMKEFEGGRREVFDDKSLANLLGPVPRDVLQEKSLPEFQRTFIAENITSAIQAKIRP